jgi:hypothetical protein
MTTERRVVAVCPAFCRDSAMRARIPPSPRLSALRMSTRYFTETTRMSDQTMSDSTPMTFAGPESMACVPRKHSRSAYRGLVPMSP